LSPDTCWYLRLPTPNLPSETNRAGGVPLDNDIVRAGLNYKIDWQHWGL
jgi:hypothetical protein